ncbi:phage tail protein I [Spartinivicinus ruber]|uniref:phage tail protein I n=1 Tax=Spartinivicinus ruber TaxID=2683272 RepID=UPI0013D42C00|nr:phage tail protein I [Spartinivicinus ruber]
MSIKHYSTLPDNQSALERALELGFQQLLDDITSPYPNLKNPVNTPEHLLPHLAQERGVSEWKTTAPVAEKRRTVADMWPIRRQAGTTQAIKQAVSSLGYECSVLPWYQSDSEPYTFDLLVSLEKKGLSQDVEQRITDRLIDAASLRDNYQINYSQPVEIGMKKGGALETWEAIKVQPYQPNQLSTIHKTCYAVGFAQLEKITLFIRHPEE